MSHRFLLKKKKGLKKNSELIQNSFFLYVHFQHKNEKGAPNQINLNVILISLSNDLTPKGISRFL